MKENNDSQNYKPNISREERARIDLENMRSDIETLENILTQARNTGITPEIISKINQMIPWWLPLLRGDPKIEDLEHLLDQMRRWENELARQAFVMQVGNVRAAEYNPYDPNKYPENSFFEKNGPYPIAPATADPTPTPKGGDINIRPIIKRLDKILIRNKEPEK